MSGLHGERCWCLTMSDNVSIMFLFETQNEVLISCIEAQLTPLLSPVTKKTGVARHSLSPKFHVNILSPCSVHLVALRENTIN